MEASTLVFTSAQTLNSTLTSPPHCDLTDNPWCGQFGAQQMIEIVVLIMVAVTGTFGNLLVITSIIYLHRQHEYGNMFLINLAFADLLVSYRGGHVDFQYNFNDSSAAKNFVRVGPVKEVVSH